MAFSARLTLLMIGCLLSPAAAQETGGFPLPSLELPLAPPVVEAPLALPPPVPAEIVDPYENPEADDDARVFAASSLAGLGVLLQQRGAHVVVIGGLGTGSGELGEGDEVVNLGGRSVTSLTDVIAAAAVAVSNRAATVVTVIRGGQRGDVTLQRRAYDVFGPQVTQIEYGDEYAVRNYWERRSAERAARFFADFALAHPRHELAASARDIAIALTFQQRQKIEPGLFARAVGGLIRRGFIYRGEGQATEMLSEDLIDGIKAFQNLYGADATGWLTFEQAQTAAELE